MLGTRNLFGLVGFLLYEKIAGFFVGYCQILSQRVPLSLRTVRRDWDKQPTISDCTDEVCSGMLYLYLLIFSFRIFINI